MWPKSLGILFLCLYLLLVGIFALTNITTVVAAQIVLGVLALLAAILLFIGK